LGINTRNHSKVFRVERVEASLPDERHGSDETIWDPQPRREPMLCEQLVRSRKLGRVRPDDRKRVEESLKVLDLRPIPTTDEEFHRHHARKAQGLSGRALKPLSRWSCTAQAINHDIGVDQNHLRGALPAIGAQSASEVDAIRNVRAIPPHPEEFRVHKIAERAQIRDTGRGDHYYNVGGPHRHVWRQRDSQFTTRRDVRRDVDRLDHALVLPVDPCREQVVPATIIANCLVRTAPPRITRQSLHLEHLHWNESGTAAGPCPRPGTGAGTGAFRSSATLRFHTDPNICEPIDTMQY
jgi:hypothetical protein